MMKTQYIKNTVQLVVVMMLFIAVNGLAQNTPILEKKINLSCNNLALENVLNKIANEAQVKFSYPSGLLPLQKGITVHYNQKPLREILVHILGPQITIKAKKDYIILTANTAEKATAPTINYTISGYVKDAASGEAIAFVSIYDTVSMLSTISNQYGYYQFKKGKKKDITIIVNKENYYDTIIYISQRPESMVNIVLYPKNKPIIIDTNTVSLNSDTLEYVPLIRIIENEVQKINFINIKNQLFKDVQVSFLPYLGTNHKLSGSTSNKYSFNVIAGLSRSTSKIEVSGFMGLNRENVSFLQLAGFGNIVGGKSSGMQAAGFMNINGKGFDGLQLAGFMNINGRTSKGATFAGFMNIGHGSMKGMQTAGFLNILDDTLQGTQLAGFSNIAKTVDGAQIAGFLNIATTVNGVQIGFINIADSVNGASIGFFTYVKKGYHRLELSGESNSELGLSFRSGTKTFYNLFSAGILKPTHFDQNNILFTFGYGIGTAIQTSKKSQITIDLSTNQVSYNGQFKTMQLLNKLNLQFDYFISPKLSVFAGPQVTYALLDKNDTQIYPTLVGLYPNSIYSYNSSTSNLHQKVSAGFKVGLRFF